MERRKQPEEKTGRDRQAGRKEQHFLVDLEPEVLPCLGRQQRDDRSQRPSSDKKATDSADERKQQRLGEQLDDDMFPSRSDGKTHRDFCRPARGASQLQVRDIGAADQQHDKRHTEEQCQRLPCLPWHNALTPVSALEVQFSRAELGQGGGRHPLLQRRFDVGDDGPILRVHRGARLFNRRPGSKAGKQIGPIGTPVVETLPARHQNLAHGNRHEHLRTGAKGRPGEPLWRNAHNRQSLTVDDERPVQHLWTARKSPTPVVVAQHHHEPAAALALVIGSEKAPERRPHAEHRKVAA